MTDHKSPSIVIIAITLESGEMSDDKSRNRSDITTIYGGLRLKHEFGRIRYPTGTLILNTNGSIVINSNGTIELNLLEIGNFLLMIIEYIRKRIIFIFDTNGIIVFDSNGIIELNSNGIIEFDSKGIVKIDLIFNTNGIIVPDSNCISFVQYWDDEAVVQTNFPPIPKGFVIKLS